MWSKYELKGEKMHHIRFVARNRGIWLTQTRIMGILNCTPDSFSDGGKYLDPDAAVARAKEMIKDGADIIDIGGQSTRPGYVSISPEMEWERIEEVINRLVKETVALLSVDTFYPQVAEKALNAGVHIINDVSGFQDTMLRTVAGSGCGCVIVHPHGECADNILSNVRKYFEDRGTAALKLGFVYDNLCFDPGIGFGKSYEDNLRLIANVSKTRITGSAYLMAASRKSVIGRSCGNPPFEQRLPGTLAAHTIALTGGADILRVHDVPQAVQAAKVANAILQHGSNFIG